MRFRMFVGIVSHYFHQILNFEFYVNHVDLIVN